MLSPQSFFTFFLIKKIELFFLYFFYFLLILMKFVLLYGQMSYQEHHPHQMAPARQRSNKINTDEKVNRSPGLRGYKGIFRDQQSRWIMGYYTIIACTTPVEAELKAI